MAIFKTLDGARGCLIAYADGIASSDSWAELIACSVAERVPLLC